MKKLLLKALERMDKARGILYEPNIAEWRMLDTADIRRELEEYERSSHDTIGDGCLPSLNSYKALDYFPEQMKLSPEVKEVSETLTDSLITAICIQAGITDPNKIEWIQERGGSVDMIRDYITFIKNYKKD